MRSRDSDHGAKELRLAHLALIAILAFVACDNEPKSGGAIPPEAIPIFETYSVPVDTVSGEIWASIPFLKFPIGIVATDEYVAVADLATDSLLILFDSRTGRFMGAGGTRQLAAGRLFRPQSIQAPQDSLDTIKLYDPFMQAVLAYRPFGPHAGYTLTAFSDALSIMQPIHLPDGRFLSTALRVTGRLGLFSERGKLVRSFGDTPAGPDAAPLFVRQHAYLSRAAVHPNRSRIALLTQTADQLEIFDTSGSRLPLGDRPFLFDPIYEVGTRRGAPAMAMVSASRVGYVDAAADSQHIYGLFSGRTIGAFQTHAFDASHIHVFSWAGRLERVITLRDWASYLAVSPDGRRLYTVSTGKEPTLRTYDLLLRSSAGVRSAH